MFEFFDKVIGFFEMAVNFVVNLVNSLMMAISAVFTAATLPATLVPFLPSIILTGVLVVVSMAVVKFIIAR